MNEITYIYQDLEEISWEAKLDNFINMVLGYLNISNWEMSITLCNNSYIKDINRQYRDKDYPTDVISFVMSDEPFPSSEMENELYTAGDIIVSLEFVKENSEYFNVPFEEELKRVLIHGILHLYGMDHETNDPKEEMLIKQEVILNQIKDMGLF